MDGPAIITQVTNPKEDEARSPVAGEKALGKETRDGNEKAMEEDIGTTTESGN